MSFTGIKVNRGVIYDENGKSIKIKTFRPLSKFFSWDTRSYNIDLHNGSWFKVRGLMWDTYYYHYRVDDPNPLVIKTQVQPIMNSDLYNTMLETKVTRDINNLAKSKLSQFLTPKNIIIGLAIIGIIVYFARGGTIT